jgi:hypothetical protein
MGRDWMKYLGLASQFFLGIGLALALGWKLDAVLAFTSPVLTWILPLLLIVSMLIKLIIETNRKKK